MIRLAACLSCDATCHGSHTNTVCILHVSDICKHTTLCGFDKVLYKLGIYICLLLLLLPGRSS